VRARSRIALLAAAATLLAAVALPAAAQASFGVAAATMSSANSDGTLDFQAGSHPYGYTATFAMNQDAEHAPEGVLNTLVYDLPAGFFGNPLATPTCPRALFDLGNIGNCPVDTQVGTIAVHLHAAPTTNDPIYDLEPPYGVAARLGFTIEGDTAIEDVYVRENDYGLRIVVSTVPSIEINSVSQTTWSIPSDPAHDAKRICHGEHGAAIEGCPSEAEDTQPFLSLPTSCQAPPQGSVSVAPEETPNALTAPVDSFLLDEAANPKALTGCEAVSFQPTISTALTSRLTSNPSGLSFELDRPNAGLESPEGILESAPEKAEVILPEGVTVNPSVAEGLAVCSEAQFEAESAQSAPGEGCPEASKLGSIRATTPVLEEPLEGSLYQAAPYANPKGSLIALYMVGRIPARGVIVKQVGEVVPNPQTGQLTGIFEGLPPLPYTGFQLHFREGARAPLVTPPACGKDLTVARFTPYSDPTHPYTVTSSFTTDHGPNAGPCPSGGTPPFHPGLIAGSINNAAGAYSPFNLRLSRTDSEQEITHFSIKLPPGITGKLAGIPFCSDASIAAAKARERTPHGGQEELERPSCPAASEVGHTLVGAGVGNSLTYVPGKLYLAGPYHGDSLSVVAITAAVAGPFDLGTVVIREGLEINPETAEVFVDATGSDPIPHIVDGIPVHLRDIRAYVDKPNFVLNPTSCEPTSTASTVLGSGTNFASESDDRPVTVTTRYQAADCANLGYKPSLQLKLKGSTKRGGTPALTATLLPRPGDANSKKVSVALPHSEFLDQAHIRTICTRVQFKEGNGNGERCPAGSVYGHAKAWTPLLSEPLEGPVFLRSSENPLPDLVLALHGLINFDAVGRIDSVNGGIRNTFEAVPDAPVTKVVLEMQGGQKGLLENSTNLCVGSHKATTEFAGQNGKAYAAKVGLQAQCGKARKKHKKAKHRKRHQLAALAAAW